MSFELREKHLLDFKKIIVNFVTDKSFFFQYHFLSSLEM